LTNGFPNNELILFVGQNYDYYLNFWNSKNSKTFESLFGWNWSAFISGPFWLGYRKMYHYMFIFALVDTVGTGIAYFDLGLGGFIIPLWFHFLLGISANSFYFMWATKQINKAKAKKLSVTGTRGEIQYRGGTSILGVILASLLIIILLILIMKIPPQLVNN